MKSIYLKILRFFNILPSADNAARYDLPVQRYTLGDQRITFNGNDTMFTILDNGKPTGASSTLSAIVYIDNECEITGGEFYAGGFRGGEFLGGEFFGGIYYGGKYYGGEFRGGVFYAGVFYDGLFKDGKFFGGAFINSICVYGEFFGGTFTNKRLRCMPFYESESGMINYEEQNI